jgi:outer membrane protein assembly factor BamB
MCHGEVILRETNKSQWRQALTALVACGLLVVAATATAWQTEEDGSASTTDWAFSVAVDPSGDVIAGGYLINTGTSLDLLVLKLLGGNGAEAWRAVINGSANGQDVGQAITTDASGDVIVGGRLAIAGAGTGDVAVLKFSASTGAEQWRTVIDGSVSGFDEVAAVAVDSFGDVIAVGNIENEDSDLFVVNGQDFAVFKFAGSNGAESWRTVIDGSASLDDSAQAVRVDASDDVIAAGYLSNTGASDDFAVVKLNGSTGAQIWKKEIDGSASGTDRALAVAVDGLGNAVAGGFLSNTGASWDFTVTELAAADGAVQ